MLRRVTLRDPVLRPSGAVGRRRGTGVLVPGVLLAAVYSLLATWSVVHGFGGPDGDGGWVDDRGRPVAHALPVVAVNGHPALRVYLVLAAILVVTALWTRHGDPGRADVRAFLGIAVAAAFVAAVILVFSALQLGLVEQAFARGSLHPPILGDAAVVVSKAARAG